MLPASIATSVAPETISKVTRLFNGSAQDVLNELLQNARRAGASMVSITTTGIPGNRLLTIVDDGSGIDDPAKIVTLGRSGWSDDIAAREDPAGMGVFSLAGRDVMIRSWSRTEHQGWCAHIPASAWESSRPIAITSDPIIRGTAITIRMPDDWGATLDRDLALAARYYPLPVTFQGKALAQEDWLANAIHVEDWNGSRIGIYHGHTPRTSTYEPRLNFHGVTLPCTLHSLKEVGSSANWTARVDIIDTPAIQLVLPARKEVVRNEAFGALEVAVRAALFRAIAKRDSHRLAFEDWNEARDIGVQLPEAEAHLQAWRPRCADIDAYYDNPGRVTDGSMIVMTGFDAIIEQPFATAIEGRSLFRGPLVDEEARLRGYSWYDALPRVENIDFLIERDGRQFKFSDIHEAPPSEKGGIAEAITMVATVSDNGSTIELSCEADAAFAADQYMWGSAEETLIFVRKGMARTAGEIADLFERAVFDPCTDSDADSRETQRTRFEREAMERVIEMLEGSEAALKAQIHRLLHGHSWIIPPDCTVEISATREEVAVTIVDRRTEAA